MIKRCKRCNIEKEIDKFSSCKASKDGLNSWCKDCKSEYSKTKYNNRVQMDLDFKLCTKCIVEKDIKNFSKGSDYDGFNKWCKDCQNEYSKKYYKINLDSLKPIRMRYTIENKEKIKEYNKNRYLNIDKEKMSINYELNKEDIKIKRSEYRKSDEYKKWMKEYRIKNKWRFKYREVLKGVISRVKSGKNGKKTKDILGYTDLEFKKHIESLFINNMSWETKDMQIDHIIPVVAFKEDTPLNIINSLENLRPIYKIDNIIKFTSIDFSYIKIYEKYIDYLIDDYRTICSEYL
jgi:hypothetical protein